LTSLELVAISVGVLAVVGVGALAVARAPVRVRAIRPRRPRRVVAARDVGSAASAAVNKLSAAASTIAPHVARTHRRLVTAGGRATAAVGRRVRAIAQGGLARAHPRPGSHPDAVRAHGPFLVASRDEVHAQPTPPPAPAANGAATVGNLLATLGGVEREAEALRRKRGEDPSERKLERASSDTEVLKAKLEAGSRDTTGDPALRRKLHSEGPARTADKSRLVDATTAPEVREATRVLVEKSRETGRNQGRAAHRRRPVKPGECRIQYWRGYVSGEFYAVVVDASRGGFEVVAKSPPFRWRRSAPPPADVSDVAAAHAALVEELERNGWVQSGRGTQWFALRFRRTARPRKEEP
jgi:hypothetical protein